MCEMPNISVSIGLTPQYSDTVLVFQPNSSPKLFSSTAGQSDHFLVRQLNSPTTFQFDSLIIWLLFSSTIR